VHILLTNDDGILAPGLAAMYRELTSLGQVTVVAPDTVQSAAAHGITINAPLTVQDIHVHGEFHGKAVAGRPVDCAKLALQELVKPRVDVVVSGINDGANVSINVLYSGTVAAAAEGALLGYPAIAVSLERGEDMDFAKAAGLARELITAMLTHDLKPGMLINVNFPHFREGVPKGVKVVPMSVQPMADHYACRSGPEGVKQYWLQGAFGELRHQHDTDLKALMEGYVTVTPLQFDMTDWELLDQVAGWKWPGF
jgi:5'-nucleotidase